MKTFLYSICLFLEPQIAVKGCSVSNQSKTFDQQFKKGFPLHKIAFPLQIFLGPNSKKIQRPTYQVPFSETITINNIDSICRMTISTHLGEMSACLYVVQL